MKSNIFIALRLSLLCFLLLSGVYTLAILGIARFAKGEGSGEAVYHQGRNVGYSQIGQSFVQDKYFQGRPSAVNYNAAGSGGSNKGPSNPDYLAVIQARVDTFRAHNPGISLDKIPSELVCASGSGLDPHLSPQSALIQVPRIARLRQLPEEKLIELVHENTSNPLFGPKVVQVLNLNIALDNMQ